MNENISKKQFITTNKITEGNRSEMTLFNKRNLSLISLGAFIWSIYFAIQGQYLNDYIADISQFTPLFISLLVSLVALTGAATSILAGSFSDNSRVNFGRRKVFILTGGITSALFFFLLPISQSIILIIGLNVFMGIFNTAAFVCNNSLIPDITSENKLGKANSIASLGTSIGTIVGFVIMLLSSSSVFYIAGAICTVGFLLVGLFFQEPKPNIEPKNWLIDIKETFNLKQMRNEKEFFRFLLSHFLLHTGINIYMPFLLIYLTQSNDPISGNLIGLGLSLQNGEVLIVFAVMTIASLLLTIPIGLFLDRSNKRHFLIIARFIFAIATAIIALAPVLRSIHPLASGIIFIIPFSLANTADIISRGAVMHVIAPKEKRGQLLGTLFLAKIIAQIPGVIIGGILAHYIQHGYQYGYLIGALFLLLSIPFLFPNKMTLKFLRKKEKKVIMS
ncbi:MAG: MFS transporter [Asgard group archaeon]|nr:MFS transporter [Asgard group archaeon]